MIVDKSALVFAKPHLDLTNELIRRYNAGERRRRRRRRPAAPPPAKPQEVEPHARHPRDRADPAAPLSVPARRPRRRDRRRTGSSPASWCRRNEPYFDGHFPGHPVMPGVLIIEALAQAGALLRRARWRLRPGDAGHLLHGDRQARSSASRWSPATCCTLEVVPLRKGKAIWKMRGEAKVGDVRGRRGRVDGRRIQPREGKE